MNLAIIKTRSIIGIKAEAVSVEVHISNGLPQLTIVGLAQAAVKESKDRVRSAILNSQYEFPCRRITVNLAPANLPKTGSGFDLPIAIGILAASGQIPKDALAQYELIAELALSGDLRGIGAIIPAILAAYKEKHRVIICEENAKEASLIDYEDIYLAQNLREVCHYFTQKSSLTRLLPRKEVTTPSAIELDWSDIKGQEHAKKALFIAALGGHSVLLSGPPGSGKTMLAKRFSTLLPNLSQKEALECASIHSVRNQATSFDQWQRPPFRHPHHTASAVALVGGGNPPKPGEISLAHHGVLFLDELTEFSKYVLETLREPLESGNICISRAAVQAEFPASFQLIAAMNPCPCGQYANPKAVCICTPERISRYLAKISGPFLDRIDIYLHVHALSQEVLLTPSTKDKGQSVALREKVALVRERQQKRQGCLNANLSPHHCEEVCSLGKEERDFLSKAMEKLKLSARGYHRLLKVARTIADLQQEESLHLLHIQEALSFRQVWSTPNI